jgi:hypothetical protein
VFTGFGEKRFAVTGIDDQRWSARINSGLGGDVSGSFTPALFGAQDAEHHR